MVGKEMLLSLQEIKARLDEAKLDKDKIAQVLRIEGVLEIVSREAYSKIKNQRSDAIYCLWGISCCNQGKIDIFQLHESLMNELFLHAHEDEDLDTRKNIYIVFGNCALAKENAEKLLSYLDQVMVRANFEKDDSCRSKLFGILQNLAFSEPNAIAMFRAVPEFLELAARDRDSVCRERVYATIQSIAVPKENRSRMVHLVNELFVRSMKEKSPECRSRIYCVIWNIACHADNSRHMIPFQWELLRRSQNEVHAESRSKIFGIIQALSSVHQNRDKMIPIVEQLMKQALGETNMECRSRIYVIIQNLTLEHENEMLSIREELLRRIKIDEKDNPEILQILRRICHRLDVWSSKQDKKEEILPSPPPPPPPPLISSSSNEQGILEPTTTTNVSKPSFEEKSNDELPTHEENRKIEPIPLVASSTTTNHTKMQDDFEKLDTATKFSSENLPETVEDVYKWCQFEGLEQIAEIIKQEQINGEALYGLYVIGAKDIPSFMTNYGVKMNESLRLVGKLRKLYG